MILGLKLECLITSEINFLYLIIVSKIELESKSADRHALCDHFCQQKVILAVDPPLAACASAPSSSVCKTACVRTCELISVKTSWLKELLSKLLVGQESCEKVFKLSCCETANHQSSGKKQLWVNSSSEAGSRKTLQSCRAYLRTYGKSSEWDEVSYLSCGNICSTLSDFVLWKHDK